MTNKYLTKLHSLERGAGAEIFKTRDPQEPSKPSKPGFEGFEGDQGWRISENRDDHRTAEPCANSKAQNEKMGTLGNLQNLQNLRSPSVPGDATRVTIVQLPAEGLRFRRVFAHLQLRPPDYIPEDRWRQCIEDGRAFLAQWGSQAEALGWDSRSLFGLHIPPERPHPSYRRLSRYDATGLVWLLQGRVVIALTADSASIRNHQTGTVTTYRKHNEPSYGPLGDSLEDLK
jgi:hypothetical protein